MLTSIKMSASLPYREDVEIWNVEHVAAWLQQRGMPEVADIYLRKGIDGHEMLNIPESKHVAVFRDLSVRKRTDILNVINQIKSQPTLPHRKSHSSRHSSQSQKKLPCQNISAQPLKKTLSLPPNRVASLHSTATQFENTDWEGYSRESDVPFIDDTPNEDYLVPLSTRGMSVVPQPPPPPRTKKERCPSPSPVPKEKNTNKQTNKEDLNDYEIIHEHPDDIEAEQIPKYKDIDDRPPDLPSRNAVHPTTQTPTVPPRTRSAQHQKLESFIPAFRNQMSSCLGSSLSVQKTSPDFVQQIGSVSVINQNSQLPQLTLLPPSHPKQAVLKKLPPPTVNSSCSSTIQQPPQTLHKPVNSFSHTRPQVTASFTRTTKLAALSNVPKVRSSAQQHSSNISASTVQHSSTSVNDNGISSTLPKVETLHLGSGKSVPLNSLYKSLLNEPYFHPVVRKTLPKLLTKERMFLVRPSTHSQHSLTLSVQERGKIFNISVRERSDGKYALGTEKIGEMTFSTVDEIIEHHRREPIRLEDGSSTYLKWTPQKENTYVRR